MAFLPLQLAPVFDTAWPVGHAGSAVQAGTRRFIHSASQLRTEAPGPGALAQAGFAAPFLKRFPRAFAPWSNEGG